MQEQLTIDPNIEKSIDTTNSQVNSNSLSRISEEKHERTNTDLLSNKSQLLQDNDNSINKENNKESSLSYSPDDYQISLPEELTSEYYDENTLNRFKEFCSSSGLTPEQAQKAVDFYLNEQFQSSELFYEQCEAELKSAWKENFSVNLSKAQSACSQLDKQLGGRLRPLLDSGLGNHPVFGEMMAIVGNMMAEDNIGIAQSAGTHDGSMSTEEFLRKVVFKNK